MRLLIKIFTQVIILQFLTSVMAQAEDKKNMTYNDFKKDHEIVISALKKSTENKHEASETLKKWEPENQHLKSYKSFWMVLWTNDFKESKALYEQLKKEKKYIVLRLELLKKLMTESNSQSSSYIMTESRSLLKQLRGTSDGELFEAEYLKWLGHGKYYSEICSHERMRWISEPEIDFVEMTSAIENCPLSLDDFLIRLRRLIFAAKEFQAQRELEIFKKNDDKKLKLEDWEKAYVQAIYDSNVGDPASAFENLSKYENKILESDYDDNYFYIAQRAGELKKAEEIISKIIQNSSGHKKTDLQFQLGFLYYQTKRYDLAYAIFDQIYQKHPSRKRKRKNRDFDQIAWLRAWTLFLDEKYEESLKAFETTKSFSNDTARLNYWMAVNLEKLTQVSESQIIFRKLADPVIDKTSFNFYNLLGWLRYQNYKLQFKNTDIIKNLITVTKSPNSYYPVPDDQITRSQLLTMYNELIDESFTTDEGQIQVVNTENEVMSSDDMAGISVDSASDLQTQIYWAQFLIEQGYPGFAKWHLFALEKNIKDRKNADPLVQFYLKQKIYYRALSLQQRVATQTNSITNYKADTLLWGALYPEAYKDNVIAKTNEKKIDPYLVWSIMRAETKYKSDAISPVGATGLMQFMPYTAQKISNLLGQNIQTTDLFQPETSIEFGATYLKKLSVELDSQKPLIAAAYNGGPHRVKQWLANLGQLDYDVFIEHIPFAETRTYTKRVLTYGAMYDKIYNTGSGSNLSFDKIKYLIQKIPYSVPKKFKLSEEWNIQLK
jgi:soluble lytic murein transglycosylase